MSSASKSSTTDRMPVVFIGHGNPMNAIRDSPFTRKLGELGEETSPSQGRPLRLRALDD